MINKVFFAGLLIVILLKLSYTQDSTYNTTDSARKVDVDENVYKEFEVEEPPQVLNLKEVMTLIRFPQKAKEDSLQGKVHLKALVDLDGSVSKVRVIDGPEVFYEESVKAAMKLKFTPAKVFGKVVKCWVTIPFNFKLN